jgi:hypothetical protein
MFFINELQYVCEIYCLFRFQFSQFIADRNMVVNLQSDVSIVM